MFQLLLLTLVISYNVSWAQEDDYRSTRRVVKDGYVYQVDNESGGIVLYNTENKYTYRTRTNKDGTEADNLVQLGITKTLIHGPVDYDLLRIISGTFINPYVPVFNLENPNELKGLIITLIIEPETGKVIEVNFMFSINSPYSRVPIEAYRNIETELIRLMQFEVTDDGKQLSHCMFFWTSDLYAPRYWAH